MNFVCEVYIRPRADILDPQGDAVLSALGHLGFEGVNEVKVGKYLILKLTAPDSSAAEQAARTMCEKLLANPITEDYTLKVSTEA
ncbi:phosphoribosylformylglycinamidine synthase subunit PurS [bacterium]|nr:phosphoribosylformylglycinamidine synthase subunit PurS [bacterium]